MSTTDQLVEQQIALHESHLKHIDELLEQARQTESAEGATDPLLTTLESERHTLAQLLDSMRGEPAENWQEAAKKYFGPMGVWQIMARLIERSIENREKRK